MNCKPPPDLPLFSQNVDKILAHFYLKLQSKAHEWRRILKTLNSIEFIIKNGSPNAIQALKREIYKLQSLSNFSHVESGKDKGQSVREKIGLIVDLLNSD
jgi:ENTH domain